MHTNPYRISFPFMILKTKEHVSIAHTLKLTIKNKRKVAMKVAHLSSVVFLLYLQLH